MPSGSSSSMARWAARRYASRPAFRSFFRFTNAGGSSTTIPKRSPSAPSRASTSNASPRRVRTRASTPFRAALRSAASSAGAEASTQTTSAAPAAAAWTPQPPAYEKTSSTRRPGAYAAIRARFILWS